MCSRAPAPGCQTTPAIPSATGLATRSIPSLWRVPPGDHPQAPRRDYVGVIEPNAATVARPVGVRPTTRVPPKSHRVPPKSHRKCCDQSCSRGLNRATAAPVIGSGAAVRVPLKLLHQPQDSQRFERSVRPPRARGTICSMCIWAPLTPWSVRQYPHRCRASSATRSRRARGIASHIRRLARAIPCRSAQRGAPGRGPCAASPCRSGRAGRRVPPAPCRLGCRDRSTRPTVVGPRRKG